MSLSLTSRPAAVPDGVLRVGAVVTLGALIIASLLVGGYDITVSGLLTDPTQREMFLISRVPRTLALVFASVAMTTSGVIMQMITQNKFVSPTTSGTAQWAGLGVLIMLLVAPSAPPLVKMVVAAVCAFAGTMVFLAILRRIKVNGSVIVPLVGMMLGAVVSAVITFLAGRFNLLQSMSVWRSGGFSSVIRGFYEPLWGVVVIAVIAWTTADRFAIAGLGEKLATNVGLDYNRTVLLGTCLVALASGITAVVVGFIPFLGLIVPNLVSMVRGDDLRSNLPWVAVVGAVLLLVCDLVGRTIIAPMEIPASVTMGIIGGVVFIAMVVRNRDRIAG